MAMRMEGGARSWLCLGKKCFEMARHVRYGRERTELRSTGTDQSFIASPTIFIQWTDLGSATHLAAVTTDQ